MTILVLGGVGEAARIAERLHADGRSVIYSMAGVGGEAPVACRVRRGGFGGAEGLAAYLAEMRVQVLVDATHPYAAGISAHAARAARMTRVPFWAYRRPPWRPAADDCWHTLPDWPSLIGALAGYRRPLFTLGRSVLAWSASRREHQHWLVRCLPPAPENVPPGIEVIAERGPFSPAAEHRLFDRWRPDVLVSKNSGGTAVAAKLTEARAHGLAVLMLDRPPLPEAERTFACPDALCEALY